MNQGLLSKYRILSLTASGFLILWYFLNIDISKINFLKDFGLKNQQIVAYILVLIIIFCIVESLIEYSKDNNKSWQLKLQLLILIALPIISFIISYPKLVGNTFLDTTQRLDIVIPIVSSIFTSIASLQLSFDIKVTLFFYKLRKTILPVHVAMLVFSLILVILGTLSINLFNSNESIINYLTRNLFFLISFLMIFIALSLKEKFISKENLSWLEKKSESLDREVETYEYNSTLRKPIKKTKNKIHKKIMKRIKRLEEEEQKAIFPRFIMLKEITFKEDGDNFVPYSDGANDDTPAIRVNFIQKNTTEIVKSEDINFKYVKKACKKIPKIDYDNDIRSFLNPMASEAYSIHLFHESDPNELMLKFSTSDEYIINLKELFKKREPDINHIASNGWTALLISVANGEEETARFLLQKAANPTIATKHGATPLHFASKYGKVSLCKMLLDYQTDVNQCDIDGKTALMIAAQYGHNAIVKLLIQYDADINLIDSNKKTALTYATDGNYGDICRYLKSESRN